LGLRTVSDLERGTHRTAHQDTARLLADALGLGDRVRGLFVAAARGRARAQEVLAAARSGASAALMAAAVSDPQPRAAPVPRELPADVSAFTGRALELAELDLLLPAQSDTGPGCAAGPVMISAVSGTAGVGKTALAVRWAHRVQDVFPDGQLYVNLRGYDPDQPLPATDALAGFLQALGVPSAGIPLGEANRAARYRSLLAGKRLLVVLDNAAAEEQVRPLLPGSGSVMVLVTSRDALTGLVARDGARRLDLDLLPLDEAVALLGALIGGRAEADPEATGTLAELCARLPLALRVAAELTVARLDTPLADLVAELDGEEHRLEFLDAGGDPRAAVASVFSWSYGHLPADAAWMFRLLGLHPAENWDRYAAAALADVSLAQAGRLLGVLASAHLIQPAPAGRFGLHDLLRAYAAGLAAAHDCDEARRAALTRLFDYYLAACAAAMDWLHPAGRHRRPDPPQTRTPLPGFGGRAAARAWLDAELPALVSIAAHTASKGWPRHTTGLGDTLCRYLFGGHFNEGRDICAQALSAARECGDRTAEASMLNALGGCYYYRGDFQRATDHFGQSLALARRVGDRLQESRALCNLATVDDQQGRYQQAANRQRQALAISRELGDRYGETAALLDLGLVCFRQGRYELAASHLQRALALSREINYRYGEAHVLTNLGEACYRQGQHQQAAVHLRDALALSREIGDRVTEVRALTRLGEVCHRQGDHDQALDHHQRALALHGKIGHSEQEAEALNGAGKTMLAAGQPGQARSLHAAALTLTRRNGDRYQQGRALIGLAEVSRQQGQHDQAADYDRQALSLLREIGDRGGQAEALNSAGETFLATRQLGQARACHTAALTLTRRTGDRYQQARAHDGLAAAWPATGDTSTAHRHWQQARDIYTELGVPEATDMRISTGPAHTEPRSAHQA
jgi:tetratricopeptide (TPR) repeat protein